MPHPFPHARLADRLVPYAGASDDPSPVQGGFLASVAVILRPGPLALELLLVRRAIAERDPWSGHMALPGGKKDAADSSLLRTALRETREEAAIPEILLGTPLGRLEVVTPRNPDLPPVSIVPFVFLVPEATPAHVASAELSEVLWVPTSRLADPGARTTYLHRLGAVNVSFPAFDLEGRVVWGLTHRILEDLVGRLPAFDEDSRPPSP